MCAPYTCTLIPSIFSVYTLPAILFLLSITRTFFPALDTQTEKKVQKTLDELAKNRTTIIIAHRLSTVRNADVIYVLGHGRLIERGSHDELMARHGKYFALYEAQKKKKEDE